MRTSFAKAALFPAAVVIGALTIAARPARPARAADITTTDIVPIASSVTGSGNGTIDVRLFTFSGSEIENDSGLFDMDNGNNALPQGGGADTSAFVHSFITTAGDLKAFYNLNFAPNSINEVVLFLDLNETGAGQDFNTLAKLDIVLNPTTVQGNPNPAGDVTSAEQVAIMQVYTGGTLAAMLNPEPALNLPVNSQGAGFADYAIFTHVDPFALADSDVLLFNVSMNTLNDGAEEIFLSGTYAPGDIVAAVPVPQSALMGLPLLALAPVLRRRVMKHR